MRRDVWTPRDGLSVAVPLVVALLVAAVLRPQGLVGIALLFVIFVPIERAFALRRQRVFRPGLATDLTHLVVNGFLVGAATIVFAVVMGLPLLWVRKFELVAHLPAPIAVVLAVALVLVGEYWGHRLTHQVPLLWRFHAVHHSIEHMDWAASARLHPLDAGFSRGFMIVPLLVLGYGRGSFAGVAIAVTLLALFQHANVRLRFPVIRWLVPTPEWHHWHHSNEPDAFDKNFGLPFVDKLFGTAFLPAGRRAMSFGTSAPVPPDGYLRHLAHPFRRAPRAPAAHPAEASGARTRSGPHRSEGRLLVGEDGLSARSTRSG